MPKFLSGTGSVESPGILSRSFKFIRTALSSPEVDLKARREQIFFAVSLSGILIGLTSYLYSLQLTLQLRLWAPAAIYTGALLWSILITLVRRIPLRARIYGILPVLYLLGLTGLTSSGLLGSGRIWLFAFSLFAGLLLGLKAGLAAWGVNVITLVVLTWLLDAGVLVWPMTLYAPELWRATGVTFVALNVLIVLALAVLLRSLEKSLNTEQLLTSELRGANDQQARAFAQVQKSAQRLQALYETSRALSSFLDEEAIIQVILQAIYRILNCEHVILSIVDETAGMIGIRHGIWNGQFDAFPEWIGLAQYPFDHSDILADLYRTGRTEIISGWDDRFNREIWEKFGHERFLRIWMPIKMRDRVIGTVEVGYDRHQKSAISEEEVKTLAAFVDQAAVALENARLYGEQRRRAEEMSRLLEISNKAQEELHESEQKLRLVFENAFDGISIHRETRDGKRVLIECNDRYAEMAGRSKTDLLAVGDTRQLQASAGLGAERRKKYQAALWQKNPYRDTFSWDRPDGQENLVEYIAVPIEVGDDMLIIGIDRDITEQERAEKERRGLREKLERAQRIESLGVLAGGVAHDLNNILGPLVAYPDLIALDLPADSPIRDDLQQIKQAAERAAAIVQDLLTLARRGTYQMVPLSLNQVIEDYGHSLSFAELTTRNPHVACAINLGDRLLNTAGSAPHLTKAIMNLVINAFEAMPSGGQLQVSTACQSLDCPLHGYEPIPAGDYVVVRVADTGVGIDPNEQGHLFEPFYTKKKMGRSGSGLGLAVVYGVVRDHKGFIDLRSRVSIGTEFTLYFPVTREALTEADLPAEVPRGDERVLVVDDLPDQREIASRLLSSLGYRVTAVSSGREALAYLRENDADILVLDMIMEDDLDGLDTYREIARLKPGQKAIVVSGFSETERVKEAQKLGAGPFLKKPYTLDGLCLIIRQELDR